MAETATVDIEMPAMGESVTEGTILEWVKNEGEFVEEGETVVEVSTDKVDAEVPAPASGVIAKVLAQVDDTVKVGQALAQLDPNGTPSGNGAGAEPAAGEQTGPGLTDGATGEGDADLGEGEPENQAGAADQATTVSCAERRRGRRDGAAHDARDGRVGDRGHRARVGQAGG